MARIRSHGVDLHFAVGGRGFPLLMLPPGGFDGSFWRAAGYVDGLRDLATCVCVDPPGLGGSTRPADPSGYAVEAIAGDVLAVCDALGFARVAVWGASLGGAIGMLLGAKHPDRVAALVLSGMHPLFDYSELLDVWRQLARRARETRDIGDAFGQFCDQEGLAADSWIRRADQGDADVVAQIFEGLLGHEWDRWARPRAFPMPTLIVVGEQEDPSDVAATVAEAMPRARRVRLDGVGHIGGVIDVDRVLSYVRPFVQAVAPDHDQALPHRGGSSVPDV